jgi:hypothetical protein
VIVAFGAGIYCLRPIVTHSIQRRLAAELNAETRISNSILSLGQSTVVLEGVAIEGTDSRISLDQLSLRLDPDELWYRNCIVDPMVGTGLRWHLPLTQSFTSLATKASLSSKDSASIPFVDWSFDPRFEQAQQLLVNATTRLSTFEKEANSQTLNLDHKIEAIRTRIHELAQEDMLVNPLRPSDGITQLKNELLMLRQLLAENRLQAQDVGSQVAKSIQQSSLLLQTESKLGIVDGQLPRITDRILEQTVDAAGSTLSPYLTAGRDLYLRIIQPSHSTSVSHSTSDGNTSRPFLAGADLTIDGLEARKMKISRGRVLGVSIVNEQTIDTEIRITSQSENPSLLILWKNSDSSSITTFSSSTNDEMMKSAFRLEKVAQGQSTLLIDTTSNDEHRTVRIEVPICNVLETTAVTQMGIAEELRNLVTNSQPVRLVATMLIPPNREEAEGSDSIAIDTFGEWQWESESKSFLESMVSTAVAQKTKDATKQSDDRISQWIGSEKTTLDRRLAALEQAALDRRKGWENQLKSLSDNIRELESDSQRTARGSSIVR